MAAFEKIACGDPLRRKDGCPCCGHLRQLPFSSMLQPLPARRFLRESSRHLRMDSSTPRHSPSLQSIQRSHRWLRPQVSSSRHRFAMPARRLPATHYLMVETADKQIGRHIATLRSNAARENTRIAFASDHGEGMGAQRVPSSLAQSQTPASQIHHCPPPLRHRNQIKPHAVHRPPQVQCVFKRCPPRAMNPATLNHHRALLNTKLKRTNDYFRTAS